MKLQYLYSSPTPQSQDYGSPDSVKKEENWRKLGKKQDRKSGIKMGSEKPGNPV